jgi:hypothetical protein
MFENAVIDCHRRQASATGQVIMLLIIAYGARSNPVLEVAAEVACPPKISGNTRMEYAKAV